MSWQTWETAINDVNNWQMSKQDIHWPIPHDRIVGSGVDSSRLRVACVAWRFCQAGRRSGVAAKFAREARVNERRNREKNKNQVASAPISSRFLCSRPPLLLSAPNQNRHATQARLRVKILHWKWRTCQCPRIEAGSLRRRLLLKNLSVELAGSHNKETITLLNWLLFIL